MSVCYFVVYSEKWFEYDVIDYDESFWYSKMNIRLETYVDKRTLLFPSMYYVWSSSISRIGYSRLPDHGAVGKPTVGSDFRLLMTKLIVRASPLATLFRRFSFSRLRAPIFAQH